MSIPEKLTRISFRNGIIYWGFWRGNIRHEIKAAACVTRGWPDKLESDKWNATAEKWAQGHAQAVCDRLDFEDSAEGLTQAAEQRFRECKMIIADAEQERAELEVAYPTITDEDSVKL